MAVDFAFWLEQAPHNSVCLGCGADYLDFHENNSCPDCGGRKWDRGWTPWFQVESSNLAAVRFKPDEGGVRGVLDVRFRSGNVYRYLGQKGGEQGVLAEVFTDLADPSVSVSKGWYFNERVKKVYDDYEKVN